MAEAARLAACVSVSAFRDHVAADVLRKRGLLFSSPNLFSGQTPANMPYRFNENPYFWA